MGKHELVETLETMEVGDELEIISESIIFGVQRVGLLGTDSIVFAAYGGELFSYWLETHSYSEIADKIEKYISGFLSDDAQRNLSLDDCKIA